MSDIVPNIASGSSWNIFRSNQEGDQEIAIVIAIYTILPLIQVLSRKAG